MYDRFSEQVKDFDKTFNCHLPSNAEIIEKLITLGVPKDKITPEAIHTLASLHRRAMFGARLGLIVEEAGEWAESFLKEKPQIEQDKELADLLYVTIGAADVLAANNFDKTEGGMDIVYHKNKQKIDNPSTMKIGANGKIIKPEDQ